MRFYTFPLYASSYPRDNGTVNIPRKTIRERVFMTRGSPLKKVGILWGVAMKQRCSVQFIFFS